MPVPDLESFKVANGEGSSATKFNNLVQAIEDEFADVDADQIAGYPASSTVFLRGDGSWATPGTAISLVTALPGSPADGDKVILTDSTSAPTFQWLLQYVAAKSSNKWIALGPVPIYAEVTASQATGSTGSYVALATAGPSVAVPVAGDYYVEQGAFIDTSGAAASGFMSYDIGGTGAVDADAVKYVAASAGAGNSAPSVMRRRKKTGLTAVTLTAKYKAVTANVTFENRWLSIQPIAVGG